MTRRRKVDDWHQPEEGPTDDTQTGPAADEEFSIGCVMGSATGEWDDVVAPGGWAGTDDDTSSAPSDRIGLPADDTLSELTGGAISDQNPMLEGEYEPPENVPDDVRNAEDRIVGGGQKGGG